ncbi:hypothetical protein ACFV2D_04985 [Streptomyces capillispiralis]|uniref:hypothetical protein n=1 Tax=Streptomyces capillispiralis TaxID=68182 RepID=UPI003677A722
MTARQELIDNGREAIEALTRDYRAAVGTVVELVQLTTGVDLTPSSRPPIMDATRPQLVDAAARARAALVAMDRVLAVTWGDARTLGEVIRDPFWTEDDRERIVEHLIRAGLS